MNKLPSLLSFTALLFLSLLLSLLFISITSVSAQTERIKKRENQTIQDRIYSTPATSDYSSFVQFSDRSTDLINRCSGTLVKPQWVVISPNGCLSDRMPDTYAYVGTTQSKPFYDGKAVGIEQVYLHPRYNTKQPWWSVNPTWNIGLAKLKEPVYGASMPELAKAKPRPGAKVRVGGLGNNMLVGDEGPVYPGLLEAQVDVVSQKICEKFLPNQGALNRSFFCGFTPYRGPCTLDEGSGAFRGGKLTGVFNLIWEGWGNPICPGAKGGGFYTAVGPARPWLRQVLHRGYDKGRFLDRGVFIFNDRAFNSYLWVGQEVRAPKMRFKRKVCMAYGSERCIKAGQWIRLSYNVTSGAKTGNYWMYPMELKLPGKKRCLRGEVKVRFRYPGRTKAVKKPFKNCMGEKQSPRLKRALKQL